MENKKEAPNPINQNNEFLTPKSNIESSEMIKEINLTIKGLDEQMYNINLKLFEKSISIEASNEKDLTKTKYCINIPYEDFTKLNQFFSQYSSTTEIFELLEDMRADEFKLVKTNPEYIEIYFLLEIRRKIIEIPIKLMKLENCLNRDLQNLSQTVQDLKDKEIADLQKKNVSLENKVLKLEEKLEILENRMTANEKVLEEYKQKIIEDKNTIDELQKSMNKEKEIINDLQQKNQGEKNKNEELQQKINDESKKIEKLEEELKEINNQKIN